MSEVFLALDRVTYELVVIKKLRIVADCNWNESESRLLTERPSRYAVRYYDIQQRERELWVNCSCFR